MLFKMRGRFSEHYPISCRQNKPSAKNFCRDLAFWTTLCFNFSSGLFSAVSVLYPKTEAYSNWSLTATEQSRADFLPSPSCFVSLFNKLQIVICLFFFLIFNSFTLLAQFIVTVTLTSFFAASLAFLLSIVLCIWRFLLKPKCDSLYMAVLNFTVVVFDHFFNIFKTILSSAQLFMCFTHLAGWCLCSFSRTACWALALVSRRSAEQVCLFKQLCTCDTGPWSKRISFSSLLFLKVFYICALFNFLLSFCL